MKKDVILMLLGAFIAALPFLGFPQVWDMVFLVTIGVFIIGVGIVVRRGKVSRMETHYHVHEEASAGS